MSKPTALEKGGKGKENGKKERGREMGLGG